MLPLDQNNRPVVSWDTRCVSLDSCPPFFFVAEIAIGPAPGHGPVRMYDLRMEISQKDRNLRANDPAYPLCLYNIPQLDYPPEMKADIFLIFIGFEEINR